MKISTIPEILMNTFFGLLLTCFIFMPTFTLAQLSAGGKPLMPDMGTSFQGNLVVDVPAPDLSLLMEQDIVSKISGQPERMGINIPVNISTANSGAIISHDGLNRTWSVSIRSEGAVGLGLYFSSFRLPESGRLYVYSKDNKQILGAYTSQNNQADGLFAIEVVKGDYLTIEYTCHSAEADIPAFEIGEVLYVYRPMFFPGDRPAKESLSGNCEVNAACSEGDNFRNQIKSVVRILIKLGNASFWCSGTVMNNTAADFSPLVLTADHCARSGSGSYAKPEDVSQWIFYFDYETPDCENAVVEENKSLTGAIKLASSSPQDNNGSDFYLVRLKNMIPASYEPFYSGWSRTGLLSSSGVGIHHPAGDVKKISTYTEPLTVSQWGQVPGTHCRVVWSSTENGHGVTEGGSSGSPLFDEQGLLIGQLTGGESGCSNLLGPDFYGQMAYSWESNGTHDSVRLKPWLDPFNLGFSSLNGTFNQSMAVARFNADKTMIPVGASVVFNDQSVGNPVKWHWEFEGGEPSFSESQAPVAVTYHRMGIYNAKLKVTNQFGADSLILENYIKVVPVVFPNPAVNEAYIMLGAQLSGDLSLRITNTLGNVVFEMDKFCPEMQSCRLDLTGLPGGLYFVAISGNDYSEINKLLIIRD